MTMCTHASFCGKRMALGDRANGCNEVDEAARHPTIDLKNPTPTAPPGPDEEPFKKCSNCYRRVTKREWKLAGGRLSCACGCWSWVEL